MKKILFLLLIFFIKLNAYEYEIYHRTDNQAKRFFIDNNNNLMIKSFDSYGRITLNSFSEVNTYVYLSQIKFGNISVPQIIYVSSENFNFYLKEDLIFLNDFYTQHINYILNYFYNNNRFSNTDFINYSDYELLYNGEGLAVASIVNDQWAGLYDNETRFASGKLYDKTGTLQYINGKAVKQMSPFDMINELFIVSVQEIFGLMSRTMCYVIGVLVVLVFAAFLFVLDLLHSSLSKVERLGSPWIATFDEKGKRVSKWGRNPNYFYHSSFNGPRNFASWRDYTDYERKLSDDSSSSNYRKKVF